MPKKILVAFDFDHTIIDENSDLYVRKLAPNGTLPGHIKALYSDNGWTEYMAAIFRYLHDTGVTKEEILQCMGEIPLTDHFQELFTHLSKDSFEVIIISDSNSVFIEEILKQKNLSNIVSSVYTNPADFTPSGCLVLQRYHTQDWCDLSTINLCKGYILESHIKSRRDAGVNFDVVAYVGDGTNDYCPSLKLGINDHLFPRVGYSLYKKLNNQKESELKATVHNWETGKEILEVLQGLE